VGQRSEGRCFRLRQFVVIIWDRKRLPTSPTVNDGSNIGVGFVGHVVGTRATPGNYPALIEEPSPIRGVSSLGVVSGSRKRLPSVVTGDSGVF
jgi:hypothetical protein